MRRIPSAFLFLAASIAPLSPVFAAPELYLGSTVRLNASSSPDGKIAIRITSPYSNRAFELRAMGPTRSPFVVASGITDGTGAGTLELSLEVEPSLVGLNAVFSAAVEPAAGSAMSVSEHRMLQLGAPLPSEPYEITFTEKDVGLGADFTFVAAALGDLDGDGSPDLLAAGLTQEGESLRVHINDGLGSFANETVERLGDAASLAARAVIFADVNGDGALDAFIGTSPTDPKNALLLNDGAGAFTLAASFPPKNGEGVRCNGAAFADFDADGDADLFIVNGVSGSHGTPSVPQANQLLLNDGAGNFTEATDHIDQGDRPPSVSRAAAAGDVDQDGDIDLIVANSDADQLLLNDGAGKLVDSSDRLPEASQSTYGVALEDLDLDGDLDVVLANTMFALSEQTLLWNQGGAQGGEPGRFEPGALPTLESGQSPLRLGLTVADVDSDGDADILYAIHELGNSERPDLYVNQGGAQGGETGVFAREVDFPVVSGVYQAIPAGDIDGDGDVDILQLSQSTPDGNRALLNQLFESPNSPLGFQRGDANADFTRDLSDAVYILSYLFLGGESPPCGLAADVNDDENIDLSDGVALLNYLFLGGAPPAAPFPDFGDDATPGKLGCDRVNAFTVNR